MQRRLGLVAVAVLAVLAACGGGGGKAADKASAGGTGSSTTTTQRNNAASAPNATGQFATLCSEMYTFNNTRGADLQASVDRLKKLTPPSELAAVWNDWLTGAVPFDQGTATKEVADKYVDAVATTASWYISHCPTTPG